MNKISTNIEQSRKLVELGIDTSTADMCWCNNFIKDINYTDEYTIHTHTVEELKSVFDETFNGWDKYWKLIPAWSLSALLDVLPSVIIRNGKRMFLTLEKAGAYNLYYKSPDRLDELWETKEELVDACVEMIIILHELNLL